MNRIFRYEFRSAEAAANSRALTRSLYGHAASIHSVVVVCIALLLPAVAIVGTNAGWWGAYSPAAVIVAGAFTILFLRYGAPYLRRWLFRPSHRGGEIEGRTVEYEFGEDGYHVRTQTFEGFQKWAGVDRIIDGKGSIMFVLGLHAHFVPDRLFETREARAAFLAWARTKLAPEARARSREP